MIEQAEVLRAARLADGGAHVFPILANKRALAPWQDNPWRRGDPVPSNAAFFGVIPASVGDGLCLIDCDPLEPDDAPLRAIPPALSRVLNECAIDVETCHSRKGVHALLAYPWQDAPRHGNNWKVQDTRGVVIAKGDIRQSAAGYAKISDFDAWERARELKPSDAARDFVAALLETRNPSGERNPALHRSVYGDRGNARFYSIRARFDGYDLNKVQGIVKSSSAAAERDGVSLDRSTNNVLQRLITHDYGAAAAEFAKWLRARDRPQLFYCQGRWYVPHGDCWRCDNRHLQTAMGVVDDWIVDLAKNSVFPPPGSDIPNPRAWLSAPERQRAFLNKTSTRADFVRRPDDLNRPPAIGLPDGSIVDGDASSLVTSTTGFTPSDGEPVEFRAMLGELLADDTAVTQWFLAWLRVALAGLSEAQSVLLYGPGGTGKSYLIKYLAECFGDYAGALQGNTLFVKDCSVHEAWKTVFLDRRLVYDADVRDAYWGSADFLKLTSGDRLRASYKGGQPFEFTPRAGLLIASNKPPMLLDDAQIRRVVPVPIEYKYVDDDGSVDMAAWIRRRGLLETERRRVTALILSMPLDEALGIVSALPQRLATLRAELLEDADPLGAWLRERRVDDNDVRVEAGQLLSAAETAGVVEDFTQTKAWLAALRNRQFTVRRIHGKQYVYGVALDADHAAQTDTPF